MSAPQLPLFEGHSFSKPLDAIRLGRQLAAVQTALADGGWWTLAELAAVAGGSEAGVSARLRDLRKKKWGSHTIERRRRGDPTSGHFEYRLAEPAQ